MMRGLVSLVLLLASIPTSTLAQHELFPQAPLDCIVRPKDMIELTSEEAGVLTEILVDRGQAIQRGQVVARLDSRVQQSAVELSRIRAENDAAISASRARLEFRRDEFSRLEQLYGKSVTSKSKLDEAAVELRLAELELEAASAENRIAEADLALAKQRLAMREIRSPVEGIVVRVTASPGEFANEQAPVMTIAKLHPLDVEAYLPIALYPRIAMGQEAEITVGPPINTVRTAVVSAIDKVFDAASSTFGVRLDLPNTDRRLPGGIKCGLRFQDANPQ